MGAEWVGGPGCYPYPVPDRVWFGTGLLRSRARVGCGVCARAWKAMPFGSLGLIIIPSHVPSPRPGLAVSRTLWVYTMGRSASRCALSQPGGGGRGEDWPASPVPRTSVGGQPTPTDTTDWAGAEPPARGGPRTLEQGPQPFREARARSSP